VNEVDKVRASERLCRAIMVDINQAFETNDSTILYWRNYPEIVGCYDNPYFDKPMARVSKDITRFRGWRIYMRLALGGLNHPNEAVHRLPCSKVEGGDIPKLSPEFL